MAAGQLVLLVNDIPDHVVAYQNALAGHGFRVMVARSGAAALELMRVETPECAVIDLRLPDMSGWDLCSTIKRQPGVDHVPVVVLTPDVSKTCAINSSKSGCDAWLAHPTVGEDLVRTIRRVLELEDRSPQSAEAALMSHVDCIACGSKQVRPTLRMSGIQYYTCRSCGLSWRSEIFATKAS